MVLIISLILIPCAMLWGDIKEAEDADPYLSVLLDGEEIGIYPLDQDRVIKIGGGNSCEIKDGRVRMIHADCPDQICVYSASIGAEGGVIVCLPNKVILRIRNSDSSAGDGLDAVVS